MQKPTTDYVTDFSSELEKIDQLEDTPAMIRDTAVNALDSALSSEMSNLTKNKLRNTKQALENIKGSSMANNFKIIYSQMCVLAVSSLEAVLKRYFINRLNDAKNINQENDKILSLKVSFAEILENQLKFGGKTGRLILEKAQLNFQDLGAIVRNFNEYANKKIVLDDQTEKNICFYLEVRHVLVHRGGKVDSKLVDATNKMKANLKEYKIGDEIELDSSDWENIKQSFIKLIETITKPPKEETHETTI